MTFQKVEIIPSKENVGQGIKEERRKLSQSILGRISPDFAKNNLRLLRKQSSNSPQILSEANNVKTILKTDLAQNKDLIKIAC